MIQLIQQCLLFFNKIICRYNSFISFLSIIEPMTILFHIHGFPLYILRFDQNQGHCLVYKSVTCNTIYTLRFCIKFNF